MTQERHDELMREGIKAYLAERKPPLSVQTAPLVVTEDQPEPSVVPRTYTYARAWVEILARVARRYHVSMNQILEPSHVNSRVIPRQVATALMRELTGLSMPEIAGLLGQHHTTVMASIRKVARVSELQSVYSEIYAQLQADGWAAGKERTAA